MSSPIEQPSSAHSLLSFFHLLVKFLGSSKDIQLFQKCLEVVRGQSSSVAVDISSAMQGKRQYNGNWLRRLPGSLEMEEKVEFFTES